MLGEVPKVGWQPVEDVVRGDIGKETGVEPRHRRVQHLVKDETRADASLLALRQFTLQCA